MKITQAKKYTSAIAIAAIVLSAGTIYTINQSHQSDVAKAYTSTANAQDPATAPDSYVVNIPDDNLKKALNAILTNLDQRANPSAPVRANNANITAGDLKRPVDPINLERKGISNLEGIQFLVNTTVLDLKDNSIKNVTPLRSLSKVSRIELSNNRITNIEPLSQMTQLTELSVASNQDLSDITSLINMKKLKDLNISGTSVDDLKSLSSITTLEKVSLANLLIRPKKINLSPLATLPNLTYVNIGANRLSSSDISVLKAAPRLAEIYARTNAITNLNELLSGGFLSLHSSSVSVIKQGYIIKLTDENRLFKNPIRGINNEVIPVAESPYIKNANADGTLNPNGEYIKITGQYASGRAAYGTNWSKKYSDNSVIDKEFAGDIQVIYSLGPKDTTKPTFDPEYPKKIISRKGVAIDLDDVDATDADSGLNDDYVTNNAADIGLDVSNPAKGIYTVQYTATDVQDNIATVDRIVEITDADELQAKARSVTPTLLTGYTTDSIQAVVDKKNAAQAVIDKMDATQAEIDQALDELNRAIGNLAVDTRPLQGAIGKYNSEPEYIQQDPAVVAALAGANHLLSDPARTPDSVRQAARDLVSALETAKQAEADRQTQATDAIAKVEQDKTPSSIADAKAKVVAVKNPTKKAELQPRIEALETDYNAKKDELKQLIARAENPATTDGASQQTKDALAQAVAAAKGVDSQANASQGAIEQQITVLKEKIAALRPDKAALQTVINSVPSESDFVKKDANVIAKLQAANDVNGRADATADQIKQVRDELIKAITDARAAEAAQQAEQDRQRQAADAIATAETPGNQSPLYFNAVQTKIDAVKDDQKKAELQAQLDKIRADYQAKLTTLRELLDKANDPALTEGMTDETKILLQQAIQQASDPARQGDVDQKTYEELTRDLQKAIDDLRADKQPLVDAEAAHDTQPDYIKNNPAVAAAFRHAQGTRAMANPPVNEVRDNARALTDAIAAAAKAEVDAQNAASAALSDGDNKLNAALAPDELPNIDIAALEQAVNAVQDPAKKADLVRQLDTLKTKFADRRQQVEDYKKSEAGQRAEAERRAKAEAERRAKAEAEAKRRAEQKAAMDNGGLLSDTGADMLAPAAGGVGAVLAGLWVLLRRKRH